MGRSGMKFVNVTDRNFEEIFEVSAKFEQWEYVKHHIFDMVNNYVAVINEAYLPIPFLVYDNERLIGFVQVNYTQENRSFEICKLIVQGAEQGRGYGMGIVSELICWVFAVFGQGTMTAAYKASNLAADRLFSKAGFSKMVSGEEAAAVMEIGQCSSRMPESDFDEIPYKSVSEFVSRIKALQKFPENQIGEEEGIHFQKVNMDDCRQIIEMHLLESQEEYVMPFVDSLAESYSDLFEDKITVTYELHNGEKPVGLVELCYGEGDEFPDLKGKPVYELFRILVDREYQKAGYGTKAVRLFLDYVSRKPLGEADDIVVSVVEGNDVALKLYERFGFQVFGRDKYGHIALRRSLTALPGRADL